MSLLFKMPKLFCVMLNLVLAIHGAILPLFLKELHNDKHIYIQIISFILQRLMYIFIYIFFQMNYIQIKCIIDLFLLLLSLTLKAPIRSAADKFCFIFPNLKKTPQKQTNNNNNREISLFWADNKYIYRTSIQSVQQCLMMLYIENTR